MFGTIALSIIIMVTCETNPSDKVKLDKLAAISDNTTKIPAFKN